MLTFVNPGEIDIRAAITLGVSVKLGESPIGQFGTGIKYVIAGVLRLGGRITVWSGEEEFKFQAVEVEIRGKEFQLVKMNGVSLGFTTKLGKHWKPWMLYRELWSNMTDEGGELVSFGVATVCPGWTQVEVECGEIEQVHANAGEVILQTAPIWASGKIACHPGPSRNLFYRGVRASSEGENSPTWQYHWNVTAESRLSEDRQLEDLWTVKTQIAQEVLQCGDREVVRNCLAELPEAGLDYDWTSIEPGEVFKQVVLERLSRKESVPDSAREVVKRGWGKEVAQAELVEVGGSWEEILAAAPGETKRESPYHWASQLELCISGLVEERDYWKRVAEGLMERLDTAGAEPELEHSP